MSIPTSPPMIAMVLGWVMVSVSADRPIPKENMASSESVPTLILYPMAVVKFDAAAVINPVAVELLPPATEPDPIDVELSPDAVDPFPMAVAKGPDAVVAAPIDVE